MKPSRWILFVVFSLLAFAQLSRPSARPRRLQQRPGVSRWNSASAKKTLLSTSSTPSLFPAPPVAYDSGGYGARSVGIADLNGDGIPDIVVADRCHTGDTGCNQNTSAEVGVLLGNGDGTFQTAVMYNTGGLEARAVALGDFNGDGITDIAVAHDGATVVGILLGKGDGTFQPATTFDTGGQQAFDLVAADVNGDQKTDLLVANRCDSTGNCQNAGTLGVLLGNGDGTFQPTVSYNTGGQYAQALTVGDFNNDGKIDVAVANQCKVYGSCTLNDGTVGILLGNGDGTFQAAVSYDAGGQPTYSVAAGDLNGDGKLDLVTANQCFSLSDCTVGGVAVLLGNGNGTFQAPVSYQASGNTTSWIVIGDLNSDGIPDVTAVNYCADSTCDNGSIDVLLGNRDGTLQAPLTCGAAGTQSYSASLADLDGDGRLDIAVANECTSAATCTDGSVGVLLNLAFSVVATPLTPSSVSLGATSTSTITLAPSAGYSGTVDLACAVSGTQSPPPTCSFNSNTIAGGSGTSTLTLTTVDSARAVVSQRHSGPWLAIFCVPLVGLCGSVFHRRRTVVLPLTCVVLLALMMISCSSGSSSGGGGGGGCPGCTAVGNYTISVTATDSLNHKIIQSISPALTLNVN